MYGRRLGRRWPPRSVQTAVAIVRVRTLATHNYGQCHGRINSPPIIPRPFAMRVFRGSDLPSVYTSTWNETECPYADCSKFVPSLSQVGSKC